MKAFDAAFFDELAALDDAAVAAVVPAQGYRPTVSDMLRAGRLTRSFADTSFDFVAALTRRSRRRYVFDPDFRVYPFHIANFSAGRAFRRQFNVGFTAGGPYRERYARIGLGFRLARSLKPQGADDYSDFLMKILVDRGRFDASFAALGGYAEPTEVFRGPVTAEAVLASNPDLTGDWRFFGRKLSAPEVEGLGSIDAFADACIRVFDTIAAAGY
jgi:hypothetical protein